MSLTRVIISITACKESKLFELHDEMRLISVGWSIWIKHFSSGSRSTWWCAIFMPVPESALWDVSFNKALLDQESVAFDWYGVLFAFLYKWSKNYWYHLFKSLLRKPDTTQLVWKRNAEFIGVNIGNQLAFKCHQYNCVPIILQVLCKLGEVSTAAMNCTALNIETYRLVSPYLIQNGSCETRLQELIPRLWSLWCHQRPGKLTTARGRSPRAVVSFPGRWSLSVGCKW